MKVTQKPWLSHQAALVGRLLSKIKKKTYIHVMSYRENQVKKAIKIASLSTVEV